MRHTVKSQHMTLHKRKTITTVIIWLKVSMSPTGKGKAESVKTLEWWYNGQYIYYFIFQTYRIVKKKSEF